MKQSEMNGGEPMSTTSLQVIPENMKTSIIRIYSYDDKNPQGTFYNLYYGEEIAFGNLNQIIIAHGRYDEQHGLPTVRGTQPPFW